MDPGYGDESCALPPPHGDKTELSAWRDTSEITALGRLESSLGYIVRPCLRTDPKGEAKKGRAFEPGYPSLNGQFAKI